MTTKPRRPRPMQPTDIARVAVVEELDVSGDGTVAVVARRVIRRGRYLTHLHAVDLSPGGRRRPRRLTDGAVVDRWPRISPDGRHVAFVRSNVEDQHEPNQLCVISIHGGAVRRLCPRGANPGFDGIARPTWSPDGDHLAFLADVDPPRFVVGEHPPIGSTASRRGSRDGQATSPVARRITRSDWRWDEIGHRDHWSHLFVVNVHGRPNLAGSPPVGSGSTPWSGTPTGGRSPLSPTVTSSGTRHPTCAPARPFGR
ncbi:MAG: hypothetical protein OER95_00925 [Acidimicrobiia bacterium]|nr:hypothetical protein [Acidimicrobiia bacterium]